MTTAATLIADALSLIQVQDPAQPVSPKKMTTGIKALNRMMARWEADGLSLGWSPVASPSDELPIPEEAEEAVEYNLAVRLAPRYGVTVEPAVIGGANTFLAALERDQAVATPIRPILSVPVPANGDGLHSGGLVAGGVVG